MNELINLMYQIKDLSTRTNDIALIDLQPRLMAVYDKLEAERLSLSDVSGKLILTPKDAEVFFNEIMNPKDANEALKKAMLKFITR